MTDAVGKMLRGAAVVEPGVAGALNWELLAADTDTEYPTDPAAIWLSFDGAADEAAANDDRRWTEARVNLPPKDQGGGVARPHHTEPRFARGSD